MKVNPETRYIVEVRKVVRDGDGNPLPTGDWPGVMVEMYEVDGMLLMYGIPITPEEGSRGYEAITKLCESS